jgi:hypothetical protein
MKFENESFADQLIKNEQHFLGNFNREILD